MKKLTGLVVISLMAGMFCFGIGERLADEVWAPKSALAASDIVSPQFKQSRRYDPAFLTLISQADDPEAMDACVAECMTSEDPEVADSCMAACVE